MSHVFRLASIWLWSACSQIHSSFHALHYHHYISVSKIVPSALLVPSVEVWLIVGISCTAALLLAAIV